MGKTLVTGGTGFVGSHVARALAERGDELRLTVRPESNLEQLEGLEYEPTRCDLLDRRAVRRALRDVDRVFHVAGLASLAPADAGRLFRVNVDATRLLLEECLGAEVERVVMTSSVAAIGPAQPGETADENTVFTAGSLGIPYVNSKHEAEIEALRIGARGLPVVCVNPCVVLGSGDVYGTATAIVRRFLLGRIPVYVDGGLNVVSVEDVARGHLLADERGAPGERYILGNRNYTLARLFADLGRISGIEPPAIELPASVALRMAALAERLPGRAPITVEEVKLVSCWWTYRNTKAKRDLGWKTSPHEDAVESTINWYLERDGERIARSRRSQPYPLKGAAIALGALDGVGGLASRLLRRG